MREKCQDICNRPKVSTRSPPKKAIVAARICMSNFTDDGSLLKSSVIPIPAAKKAPPQKMAPSLQSGVKWLRNVPVVFRRVWPRKKDAIMASPPLLGIAPVWTFRAFGRSRAPKRVPILRAIGVNRKPSKRVVRKQANGIRIMLNIDINEH